MLPYLVKCIPNLSVSQLCRFQSLNSWVEKTKKVDENDKMVKEEKIDFEPLRVSRFQISSIDSNIGNEAGVAFADLIQSLLINKQPNLGDVSITTEKAIELAMEKTPLNTITQSAIIRVIQDISDDMIDPHAVEDCINGE